MAESTKDPLLKRSFSPGLEDEVTAIETKAARISGPSDDLEDNTKRWLTAGICLHTVISPVLREYILPVIIKLYYRLTIVHHIDRQTYPCYLPTYLSKKLNYETINNNKNVFGKSLKRYDYRVQNPIELSKLFLPTHMTKYQYIDDSCDSSALLGIITNIDDFPVSVRTNSEKVRSCIRNPWAHCNFSEWDNGKFSTTFREMENLINNLTMKVSKKRTILDELTKWETNGTRFFQGTTLGLELVKEIREQTSVLAKYSKVLNCILKNDMESKAAADKVIQDELRTLKEKIKTITRCQDEIIPKHIRDGHQDEIRDWEKDDEVFVETRATEQVMSSLSKCNIAVVTGSSGTGKSYLIHHVALELRRQKKYDIIPVSFVNAPSTIMNYYCKSKNQVFVIDDICGKGTINVQLVNIWKDLAEKIKDKFKSNSTDPEGTMPSKLLISCRLQVFNDSQFEGLTLFTENAFNLLSKRISLLPDERILMLKKYIKSDKIDDLIEFIFDYDFFPLMCKMSKNISHEKLIPFFASPVNAIKEQIKNIIDSINKPQLCALILCILFEEGFKDEWLKCRLKAVSEILRNKLKGIARHCDIDFESELSRRSLKNGFSALEGTFLRKVGTKYSIIHDKLYDIASIVCGQHFKECFIRYSDGRFIADKYLFRSIETNPTDCFIVLPEDMEDEYFERLIEDLKQRDVYSTLYNKQLVHKSFRQKLIRYLSNTVENVKDLFDQIEQNGINFDTDEVHYYWDKTDNTLLDVADRVTIVTYPLIKAATEGYADIVEFLIKMNCKVNKTDSYGRSALYNACKGGHLEAVEILIKHNADFSLCSEEESSPLHMACKSGSIDIVKLILAKNVDVCKLDRYHISPLREACHEGNVNIVRLLLQNETDVHVSDKFLGFCPLHAACEAGHLDVVQYLLENHSDVNRISHFGDTPLSLACEGGFEDVTRKLLNYNAKVSVKSQNKSPLVLACKTGNAELVKMLLANSTDIYPNISTQVNCLDDICSPLFVACKRNHINIVQLLLKKCKDRISVFDKCFSLCEASFYGCLDIVKILMENTDFRLLDDLKLIIYVSMYLACNGGYIDIVQHLLTQGIDIFQCSEKGRSLLHATCEGFCEGEGHNSIIELLIQNQLDISKPDENGSSPLHLACENGLVSICKLLIRNKADINMQDSEHRSPLHLACQRQNSDIVEILLENKANIKLYDNTGKTPLHLICERFKDSPYFRPWMDISPCMFVIEMFTKLKYTVKSLIDLGAEVNSCDSEGETPLHKACRYGDYELVQILLSSIKSSNVNLQNFTGQTPLHFACKSGYKNICELLLEKKADIYKEDEEGNSPLKVISDILIKIKMYLIVLKSLDNLDAADNFYSISDAYCRIFTLLYNEDMTKRYS